MPPNAAPRPFKRDQVFWPGTAHWYRAEGKASLRLTSHGRAPAHHRPRIPKHVPESTRLIGAKSGEYGGVVRVGGHRSASNSACFALLIVWHRLLFLAQTAARRLPWFSLAQTATNSLTVELCYMFRRVHSCLCWNCKVRLTYILDRYLQGRAGEFIDMIQSNVRFSSLRRKRVDFVLDPRQIHENKIWEIQVPTCAPRALLDRPLSIMI